MIDYSTYTDMALLAEIREQRHAAFATLVRRHTQKFYALAFRTLGVKVDAEDVVQDCFLDLWRRPHMFNPDAGAAFTTWFYRKVLNASIDLLRKKKPMFEIDNIPITDMDPSVEESMIKSEQAEAMEAAIRELPERQQTALNLCFYEGISNSEAGEIMGVNAKAVQSLLMRAKTTLKEKLNKRLDQKGWRHAG